MVRGAVPLDVGAAIVSVMVWLAAVVFRIVGVPGGENGSGVTTPLLAQVAVWPVETRSHAGSLPNTISGLPELAVDMFCPS